MSEQACCAPRQLCALINKPTEGERWPCTTFPSSPSVGAISRSPLCFSPPSAGVSALPPGQLKDRLQPLGPFSGDRGLKEPRREPPSSCPASQLSMGGAPPLKLRRHSDADKPKGKRPCKTKHTSLRDREKKKDGALSGPGQHGRAELGASEEDKVRAETAWPRYGRLAARCRGFSVCLSVPLIMQLGRRAGGRAGGLQAGGGSMFTMFRGLLEL